MTHQSLCPGVFVNDIYVLVKWQFRTITE